MCPLSGLMIAMQSVCHIFAQISPLIHSSSFSCGIGTRHELSAPQLSVTCRQACTDTSQAECANKIMPLICRTLACRCIGLCDAGSAYAAHLAVFQKGKCFVDLPHVPHLHTALQVQRCGVQPRQSAGPITDYQGLLVMCQAPAISKRRRGDCAIFQICRRVDVGLS